jgi:Bifunctional DNA primase/polymerase, N-terminal
MSGLPANEVRDRHRTVLDWAVHYVSCGLAVVPIMPNGQKRPPHGFALRTYFRRRPAPRELGRWFGPGGVYEGHGLAVVCGQVSGLEVFDFDDPAVYDEWARRLLAEDARAFDAAPRVRTPAGGRHVYFFSPSPGPCRKLAWGAGSKTLIEIKGEGGYVLAPGCPGPCHPLGAEYVWERPLPESLEGSNGREQWPV